MRQIIACGPPLSVDATKPCQVLHYDSIILDTGFEGSKAFAYFTDPVTKKNWGFPLRNKSESEQIRCIKYMVNMVERFYGFYVLVIHSDQETGIGFNTQNWVKELGIRFEWYATDTPSQNGIAERQGHMLTVKARCIRIQANLPEDMWPECYLAAVYLNDRVPRKSLGWKSPIEKINDFANLPIKHELAHLRRHGCKSYVLFKEKSKPKKSAKLQPRAFIGYFVGYDSTNIYRIWDPKRYTVKGYRDVIFDENSLYNPNAEEVPIAIPEELPLEDAIFTMSEPLSYRIDITDEEDEWLQIRPSLRPDSASKFPTKDAENSTSSESTRETRLLTSESMPPPSPPAFDPNEMPETGHSPLDKLRPHTDKVRVKDRGITVPAEFSDYR